MGIFILLGGIALVTAIFAAVKYLFITYGGKGGKEDDTWLSKRLEAEKSQSDIILNAIEDGVVVIDEKRTIRLFNPAAARLTGWPQEEATDITYANVLHLTDEKNVEYTAANNPFERVFVEGKTIRDNKAQLITRSNKSLSIMLSVSPLFDHNQKVSGVAGVFRDVSEERQEERQRAEFISTASHEMRTPVAAIEGYLALAMNDKISHIDTAAQGYLQKAHEATEHLGKLFQDLLTSARAEDGRLSNHPVVVEMSKFLEDLTEDLRFTAEKKSLGIEYVVGTTGAAVDQTTEGSARVVQPLYHVQVDPERLREVITNLFDNAVKYTDKGKISLGLTGDANVVQLYIRDTGVGISPEDTPHLFEKFYRVDNSATRSTNGTGLGLFISRKIVELYNGKIWVESQSGQGSTFFINLPRLSNQKVEELKSLEMNNLPIAPPANSTA